jgi:murein DD-endopeptidase MepM/ murein hydrolase activator NlpD
LGNSPTSLALAAAAALALPATAGAQATGGMYAGAPPTVAGITCQAGCSGLDRAAPGSTVRISGSAMKGASAVVFLGGRGTRDDVRAGVTSARPSSVEVVVPARARSGRVLVLGSAGQPSAPSRRPVEIGRATASGATVIEARVVRKRVFLEGGSKARLRFFVSGRRPAPVRVDLLHDGDPVPVATWTPPAAEPGAIQTIAWDGTTAGATAPAEGRYEFRVSADTGGASAAQAVSTASSAFLLLAHAFPIQGPHRIGMSANQRFGAARSGHSHQGQDVFARCGTPLVAAMGGKVKFKAFQSAAGNYLVIATDEGVDHAYMHLKAPALVAKGDRVTTGQLLGYVGDTGDADGCHLHFEKWSAPGWYTGGQPVDPLADLQAWDALP